MNNYVNIGDVVDKYKKIYQKYQPTYSPAIDDKVYFNMTGFKHLISFGSKSR